MYVRILNRVKKIFNFISRKALRIERANYQHFVATKSHDKTLCAHRTRTLVRTAQMYELDVPGRVDEFAVLPTNRY